MSDILYGDYDVLIGVDRRGIVHVLKHRTERIGNIKAEVKLSVTETREYEFRSREADSLNLAPAGLGGTPQSTTATGMHAIIAALEQASANRDYVYITGYKVDGTSYHERKVEAVEVSGNYLICNDADTGARRSFRIDGISTVMVPA